MSVDVLLRVLARLMPPLVRPRYLEEWRADLLGAAQLGLPRRGVLIGAAVLLVRIDRDRPEHSGEPRRAVPRRLARRGAGLVVAAASVLLGTWVTAGIAPEPGAAPAPVAAALTVVTWSLLVLALLAGIAGAVLLIGAGIAARTRLARLSLLALVAGGTSACVGLLSPSRSLVPLGSAVVFAGLVGALVVLTGSAPLEFQHRQALRRHRIPVAACGLVLLIAVVVLGGSDLLVWNPMVKVPGRGLGSIYALMVERDHFDIGLNVGSVAVWALFWSVAGIVVTVGACVGRVSSLTPRRLAIILLGLVGAAVFFRFFAGFGIGLSLGDSFDTGGGDGSLVSALLNITGQLAIAAAAIAFGWAPRAPSSAPLPTS